MKQEDTLFVFYALSGCSCSCQEWEYMKMPKNWSFVGKGTTTPPGYKPLKYCFVHQFRGPKTTIKSMRKYLNNVFKHLQDKYVISMFKINTTYSP